MKIAKVYKENMPTVRLVGKRYTNADRDGTGTFATHWQQWFREGWFNSLKKGCTAIPGVSEDTLGAMRMTDGGGFEYWIGIFAAPETAVPEGFASAGIPAGEVGVVWLCGNEKNGELYGMEASDLSMGALTEKGWKYANDGWFFERYNNPRFTKPDEDGNVILDICAYLV